MFNVDINWILLMLKRLWKHLHGSAVRCMCKKMERANTHIFINMEMNNKLKMITDNCNHFVCGGHKFDFPNSLFCETDFLFLSEHWLYESEFYDLSAIGQSAGVVATSAMDQHNECVGRPYGGTAIIVWHSSINGKVENLTVIITSYVQLY